MNAWCLYNQKSDYNIHSPPVAGYCHEMIRSFTSCFSKNHFNNFQYCTVHVNMRFWCFKVYKLCIGWKSKIVFHFNIILPYTHTFRMFSWYLTNIFFIHFSMSVLNLVRKWIRLQRGSTYIPQGLGGSKRKMQMALLGVTTHTSHNDNITSANQATYIRGQFNK
jgi:hypothetical protein